MGRRYVLDLHVHTCLSPCGASSAVPTKIVDAALQRGLDGIGICDHNASENIEAVREAAEGTPLTVFGGMEITTREEIHLLALLPGVDEMETLQRMVYENLPGQNDEAVFGPQYVVDREDYIVEINTRLLIGATGLGFEEAIALIGGLNGAAVAAHIDRESFGALSQLGFLPTGLTLNGAEISRNWRKSPFSWDGIEYPLVSFSDAHSPEEIGAVSTGFAMEAPTVEGLKQALAEGNGRGVFLPEV